MYNRTRGRIFAAALAVVLLPVGVLGLWGRKPAPAESAGATESGTACAVPRGLLAGASPGAACASPDGAKEQASMTSTQDATTAGPGARASGLPPIDRAVPARTELATFAMG